MVSIPSLLGDYAKNFASVSVFSPSVYNSATVNTGASYSSGESFILVLVKQDTASAVWYFSPFR